MIVIEGPDNSGKTRLAEDLSDHFGFSIAARGTPDRNKLYEVTRQDTHKALAFAVECKHPPLIWDRLFYSDFVYAPIANKRPIAFTPHETYLVHELIELLNCPIIMCLPPRDVVMGDKLHDEEQMPGVAENIGAIYDEYARMFFDIGKFHTAGRYPALWYDYTGGLVMADGVPLTHSVEVVFAHIQEYLELRKEREPWRH